MMIRTAPLLFVLTLVVAAPALAQTAPPAAQSPDTRIAALTAAARAAADAQDYAASETAWRGVLDIQTSRLGPDAPALGATLLELALQVSNQQRFDEAQALLRRAAPIIDAGTDNSLRARITLYRALDAANRRDYADAMQYARDVAAARQAQIDQARGTDSLGDAPPAPATLVGELVRARRLEAEMALRLGDLAGADAAAQQAVYLLADQPNLPLGWRPQLLGLLGDINTARGRTPEAERNYVQALAIDKKLFGADAAPTIAAGLALGRFYAGEQIYTPALSAYRDAFAALETNAPARAAIVADQIIPFFDVATAASPDARLEAAIFTASQMIGTGVEGQTIARVAARRAAQNPALAAEVAAADDAARGESDLRLQLAAEHAKSDDERDAAREKLLAAAMPDATAKAAMLAQKLRTDFPAYARLAEPQPVALPALQKALGPHEAFVSYLLGVKRGYVLLATADGLTVKPMPMGSAQIGAGITMLRAALVPRLGKLPDFNSAAALALYRALLAPVETRLAGITHLVVSADGDLASLPFSLLLTSEAGRDYAHAPWLIRKLAVSDVPSPSAFIALRAAPPPAAPRPLLAVGDPAFDGKPGPALAALATTCQTGAATNAALLRALPPLPDTAGEVQAVARDLHAASDDILLGAAASETALRARPLDQYAVLYFATHGVLPGELHCQAEPGLVLSPPSVTAQSPAGDGLLTASEVAGLRLNASLVVLSACNTAAAGGTGFGGSALQGLADAFFEAGAHAVLASHWEVPSAATASLMIAVFDNRASQKPEAADTAAALRAAQLALIGRPATAHPYNWAAFTLIGDGR